MRTGEAWRHSSPTAAILALKAYETALACKLNSLAIAVLMRGCWIKALKAAYSFILATMTPMVFHRAMSPILNSYPSIRNNFSMLLQNWESLTMGFSVLCERSSGHGAIPKLQRLGMRAN